MKLGKFFGITAPMFVTYFEDVNAGVEFLKTVSFQYPSESRFLRHELKQLLKIKQLAEFKVNTEVPEELVDDRWENGGLVLHPDWTEVIKQQFTDAVIAKLLNTGVKTNKSLVNEAVSDYLKQETFELIDLKRNVLSCSKTVQSVDVQGLTGEGILCELKDTIVIDGKRHVVTLEERKVINYFLGRLNDIEVFINSISDRKSDNGVFNTSLSRFVTRKPAALYYVVADKLSGLYNCYDDASFTHILNITRDAVTEYKNLFEKHVKVLGETDSIAMEFTPEQKKLLDSLDYTNPGMYSNEVNEFILSVASVVKEMTHDYLTKKFDIDTDWNSFGYDLCNFGLYGINESTHELLKEYLANFISFETFIYLSEEELNERKKVIEDVECLFRTYQPFGMEI